MYASSITGHWKARIRAVRQLRLYFLPPYPPELNLEEPHLERCRPPKMRPLHTSCSISPPPFPTSSGTLSVSGSEPFDLAHPALRNSGRHIAPDASGLSLYFKEANPFAKFIRDRHDPDKMQLIRRAARQTIRDSRGRYNVAR
jgi:hypothetical protein